MNQNKEKLLQELKKDSFQPNVFIETKLQPLINPTRFRSFGIKELDDIRMQVKIQRKFLEEVHQDLEKKKAATAKRDKFQEKFTYQNLKVFYISKT
jgi:hypothetical protein